MGNLSTGGPGLRTCFLPGPLSAFGLASLPQNSR